MAGIELAMVGEKNISEMEVKNIHPLIPDFCCRVFEKKKLHSGIPTNLLSWRMPEDKKPFRCVTFFETLKLSIAGSKFHDVLKGEQLGVRQHGKT